MIKKSKNSNEIKRVLVTGGAGFIGSSLCEKLLHLNYEVICFDNLATGKEKNIEHLFDNPTFSFIQGDIRNSAQIKDAMDGVQAVLHQAALGSVPRSIKDPLTSHEVNVTGFLNVLHAAKEMGIKRFIYASSSSVYGSNPALPKKEDSVGLPLSPYAATKYANELYAHSYGVLYPEMEIIGLRYFNVFGRRQSPEGAYAAAIPKFIKALINHQSPEIFGDGKQSRDFTYIDNVVQANILALTTDNLSAFNQVYNVACGQSITVNQIISLLIQFLGKYDPEILNLTPIYSSPRIGDVVHSLASIEKAANQLGYKPTHGFEEGIKQSIEWYWENINQPIAVLTNSNGPF